MNFLIADSFTASLARLTGREQKAAKTAAFDLQLNPAQPGLSLHRVDAARDPNFWSARVNDGLRLIVHRTPASLLLAYVGRHDAAYAWAERRRIERHPATGAMQIVEVRARVEEVRAPAPQPSARPALFDTLGKVELMAFGVPEDWVNDVRATTEDTLFDVIAHLPQEAQEALLKLAVGETPAPPEPVAPEADPFAHPDAQRRFRPMANVEELRRALDYPWDKWAVFLHPAQEALVARAFNGPARVSGSGGTGKTIVALHRAAHLARANPAARVLLTTFSKPLANALRLRLRSLLAEDAATAARIEVKALNAVGYDLYAARFGQPQIAPPALIATLVARAAVAVEGHRFTQRFLMGEWSDVVDAWGLRDWEGYRDVARLGRKTRVGARQRESLWAIFELVRAGLTERGVVTWADAFHRLAATPDLRPFDHAVVDEAQDLGVAEARFLVVMAGDRPDGLFFAGDLGQRIFQQPFSWKALGIDVRGRSASLRINYRTSHQIRTHADRLLPATVADVDGAEESRRGTVSTFDGPPPTVMECADPATEQAAVAAWIIARLADGCAAHEIAVIVRSDAELKRARASVKAAGARAVELSDKVEVEGGAVAISAMHQTKGLEFRAVAVMACDDEIIPLQSRIEAVGDDADLQEVYDTERHLLYVACTRARDHLLVTGVRPVSAFMADLPPSST